MNINDIELYYIFIQYITMWILIIILNISHYLYETLVGIKQSKN